MRLVLAIAAALAAAACHPFGDMVTDKEFVVPGEDVAKVEFLVPDRRLPRSARDVRVHVQHFQDTSFRIRFDADEAEARAFAESLTGRPLSAAGCGSMSGSKDWWITPEELQRAECTKGRRPDDGAMPAVEIALLHTGDGVTVWLHTFTT